MTTKRSDIRCRALALAAAFLGPSLASAGPADDFAALCRGRADEAKAANQPVVRGVGDCLFLSSELRHIGVGRFWGEAAQTASAATREDARDPLPAIVDTARQLRERGIALLVVPVPPRAVVYADKLWAGAPRDAAGVPLRLDSALAEFHAQLRANDVESLDLTDTLLAARAQDADEGPVYCRQDSHWSPRGIAVAAAAIGRRLAEGPKVARGALETRPVVETVELRGDLWTMLGDDTLERERIPLLGVRGADGQIVADDPGAPVLLLADSHGLVFHDGGDMHAEGAGLGDHLAAVLGSALDRLARRGSAATAVRVDLARRIRAEPGLADVKKVVVWCFAARELTESSGWRKVPLFPSKE